MPSPVVFVQRHCENAAKIVSFLVGHPGVDQVYWPGLETHKNHHVAAQQMRGFGGMISFTLKRDRLEDALEFVKRVHSSPRWIWNLQWVNISPLPGAEGSHRESIMCCAT